MTTQCWLASTELSKVEPFNVEGSDSNSRLFMALMGIAMRAISRTRPQRNADIERLLETFRLGNDRAHYDGDAGIASSRSRGER